MPLYENVFIARQDISAQQVESLTESFQTIVSEGGGSIEKTEYWGLKNLVYRIKKNRKGHYVLMNIDAPSSAVDELTRNMRLNEDIIRHLTLKVDEHEEAPSAMMQSRSARDGARRDRGPGRDRDDRDRNSRDRGEARGQATESAAPAAQTEPVASKETGDS